MTLPVSQPWTCHCGGSLLPFRAGRRCDRCGEDVAPEVTARGELELALAEAFRLQYNADISAPERARRRFNLGVYLESRRSS